MSTFGFQIDRRVGSPLGGQTRRIGAFVVLLAVALAAIGPALGQGKPGYSGSGCGEYFDVGAHAFGVLETEGTCEHFAEPSVLSTGCLYTYSAIVGPSPYPRGGLPLSSDVRGRPMNLDVRAAFGPPDFPPRETDWVLSSLPLVSRESAYLHGPAPFVKRPTLNGVIDLMTGRPLIQAIDFELPFGSAVFRHIRTYSEPFSTQPPTEMDDPFENLYEYWDWNGYRWMMSENPILLFDADYWWNADAGSQRPRTCHFILDAHHAVPFDQDEATGRFVSPPWFDAVMEHNGQGWDPQAKTWSQWPSHVTIWLQSGGVKYTIRLVYDDVFLEMHPSPSQVTQVPDPLFGYVPEGWLNGGIPYYGLVESISDRNGNRIIHHYCAKSTGQMAPLDPNNVLCRLCEENCSEKGQLAAVELIDASGTVTCTLLYTYRSLDRQCTGEQEALGNGSFYTQNILHSIHVYEGALPAQQLNECRTLPGDLFCCAGSWDEIDAITDPSLPNNWLIEARYVHDNYTVTDWGGREFYPCDFDMQHINQLDAAMENGEAFWNGEGVRNRGNLYKVAITRRDEADPDGGARTQYTLYRWRPSTSNQDPASNANPKLRGILDNDSIQTVLRGAQAVGLSLNVNDLLEISNGTDAVAPADPPLDPNELVNQGLVPIINPQSNGIEYHQFITTGRYEFRSPEMSIYDFGEHWSPPTNDPNSPVGVRRELVRTFAPPDWKVLLAEVGVRQFVDRSGNPEQDGHYVLHYFHVLPPDYGGGYDPDLLSHRPTHRWKALDRWPYRYLISSNPLSFGDADLSQPRYVVVIEKVLPEEMTSQWGADIDPSTGYFPGLVNRRLVGINPAGFTLFERTWSYEYDRNGLLVGSEGIRETYEYDCYGRVIKKLSAGLNSPENEDPQNNGLIYRYAYEDDNCPPCGGSSTCNRAGRLRYVALQKGTEGPLYLLERYSHGIADRPDLVTLEERFSTPVPVDSGALADEWTRYDYSLESVSPDAQPFEKRVRERAAIQPIGPPAPGEPPAFAIARQRNNADGNEEWSGIGLLADAQDLESALVFFASHHEYNPDRPWERIRSVIDADDPNAPPGFERVANDPAVAQALAEETQFAYDLTRGLTHISHPNGRETHFHYDDEPNGVEMQWVYKDVYSGQDNAKFTDTPVEVNRFEYGKLVSRTTIAIDGPLCICGAEQYDQNDVIAVTYPKYDYAGRLIGVAQEGVGASVSAYVLPNGFGQPAKVVDTDGTITRHVYDSLGRLWKTYRGTAEENPYWGYPPPEDPNCLSEEPVQFPSDNLALVERRYYGSGVTDANQLTAIRSYRDYSALQYPTWYVDPNNCAGLIVDYANDDDDRGWLTSFEYDWRMRRVWQESVSEMGLPLGHTLTWYDNRDRVRLVAEFGPTPPGGAGYPDPRTLEPGQSVPPAADILAMAGATGGNLLSLAETIYNPAGLVAESRQYDVSDATGSSYLATRNWYNHAGRPTEVHAPGSADQQYVYDAKGRQVVARSVAAGVEITRTETTFDSNDRALSTTHYERLPDASGDQLDASNAVITYTHTWYDVAGRVIAVASYGTNRPDNAFANGIAPIRGPNPPPSDTSNALVTRYEYDDAGRQSAVIHPDGTRTEYEYDDLGRQTAMIENAGGAPNKIRRTEYVYNPQTNQLTQMIAVQPPGAAPDQVTQFVYDALAVDHTGAPISRNKSWIAAVHYPDPVSGQPSAAPDLSFTYYIDGSVATRTDARGVVFTYRYDEFGRCIETLVDDAAWYAGPGDPADLNPLLPPPFRISRIEHDYSPDGRLTTTTAWHNDAGGEVLHSQNRYEYGPNWNLVVEWQALAGPITPTTPRVDYAWDYSSADPSAGGENRNRLWKLKYPRRTADGTRRTIELSYGPPGSADDLLGRIVSITDTTTGANATYHYGGLARRAGVSFGNGVCANLADPDGECDAAVDGYFGLDRFGRVRDLHYRAGTGVPPVTLHRYQYDYDKSGNRLHARVTQAPVADEQNPGQLRAHVNDRSYLYTYDALQRLTYYSEQYTVYT
ncbi:MAG: RHS repeat protein, partial [Phycisphaerae bacterium]|jgi:YD repeat-containing protein